MGVTRRELLEVIGLGALVGAYSVGAIALNWKGSPQKPIRGEFEYPGLPEMLKKAGFECGQKTRRNTSSEVIIFAEQPDDRGIKIREAAVIDFLIEYHGFDAIGLAGLYGLPSSELAETVRGEFHAFFEDKTWFENLDGNTKYIIDLPKLGPLGKYARQESVRTFGIEDKMLFFESMALEALMIISKYVNIMREQKKPEDPLRPYGEVPFVGQMEELYEVIRGKFPDIPCPGENLRDLSLNMGARSSEFKRFQEYILEFEHGGRNYVAAEVIAKQMKSEGSERTIIVTPYSTVLTPGELLAMVESDNFRKGYNPKFSTLQGCLSNSAMVIDAIRNPTRGKRIAASPLIFQGSFHNSILNPAYAGRHA